MNNKQTGFVLLQVDYDSDRFDLTDITHKMVGGQNLINLQVLETVDPDDVPDSHPFIAF